MSVKQKGGGHSDVITRRSLLLFGLATTSLSILACARARPTTAEGTPAPTFAVPAQATRVPQSGNAVSSVEMTSTRTPPTVTPTLVPPKSTITPTSAPPTPTIMPVGTPSAVTIPRIGVDAPITRIGTRSDGNLDAPDGPKTIGWFTGGPRPGEPGNALLTGHLDWHTGEIGVFWRLKEVQIGDDVIVATDRGKLDFTVESSSLFNRNNAPVEQILGFAIGRVITIMTCEGTFIPNERDYTHRRVVRARLA